VEGAGDRVEGVGDRVEGVGNQVEGEIVAGQVQGQVGRVEEALSGRQAAMVDFRGREGKDEPDLCLGDKTPLGRRNFPNKEEIKVIRPRT